ncbi:MAG: adenosylcobinamide-GDP ribazoletransferase [Lachnospiraceae bacterium]|nr:adenosylcobinamide-GDP ribazoletransferase [Lachnospiraceae bacterium]
MRLLKSFAAAFSTYSRIPMPPVRLDAEDMRYCMVFFPFIGAVIGALELLWWLVCTRLALPQTAFALLAAFIPMAVTGGIHLDGFVDSMDALNSFGGTEKRLEILKDPHVGAFGVIKLVQYAVLYVFCTVLIARFGAKLVPVYALGFVLSRVLSGLGVTYFPGAKKDGMVASIRQQDDARITGSFLIIELAVAACFMVIVSHAAGLIAVAVSLLCFAWYRRRAIRDFGGVTGDTAGCFLSMCELAQALTLAICAVVMHLAA